MLHMVKKSCSLGIDCHFANIYDKKLNEKSFLWEEAKMYQSRQEKLRFKLCFVWKY